MFRNVIWESLHVLNYYDFVIHLRYKVHAGLPFLDENYTCVNNDTKSVLQPLTLAFNPKLYLLEAIFSVHLYKYINYVRNFIHGMNYFWISFLNHKKDKLLSIYIIYGYSSKSIITLKTHWIFQHVAYPFGLAFA